MTLGFEDHRGQSLDHHVTSRHIRAGAVSMTDLWDANLDRLAGLRPPGLPAVVTLPGFPPCSL